MPDPDPHELPYLFGLVLATVAELVDVMAEQERTIFRLRQELEQAERDDPCSVPSPAS